MKPGRTAGRIICAALALCWLPTLTMAESLMAMRPEGFFSSDADGNETRKSTLGWDWSRSDREHWMGAAVEHASFAGDDWSHEEQRLYGRAAGTFGRGEVTENSWRWQAKLGSNGHTALGSASLNTEGASRREIFFERELLETRSGTERGQMYNVLGAAVDQSFGARWSGTALAGVQTFSDDNLRTHLRGNLVFVALPEFGISAQVRTRYFRDSEPYGGNYYSPEWYGQALGVLALRRIVHGYTWRAAVGLGRQRTADDDWRRARLVEAGVESPRWRQSWVRVMAGYTDTPVATSTGMGSYSYRYLMLDCVIAF